MGMPTRNTMVVPCMVKSRLKVCGGTTWSPGQASCTRIMVASEPAMTKKTSPVSTYMMPRRLWSTVTTQSWSWSRRARGTPASSGRVAVGERTLIARSSLEGDKIRGERIEVPTRELHGGHEGAVLEGGRIVHPRLEVLVSVAGRPRPDRPPGHQVRQVGTEHAVGRGAADSMAVDAGEGGKELPARAGRRVVTSRGLLGGDPALELVPRMHHDHQQHQGMLEAAVLRALPDIGPRRARLDPDAVGLVGNHVHLARELRHPEAVDDVDGLEGDKGGRGAARVAHRHVELIGGD